MNDRIRVPEVRVIGPGGEQLGIMPTEKAISEAQSMDFDLVEVAPQATPPVCKIMDYGKFKYEQDVKAKDSRKRQHQSEVKGMRFSLKISKHDFETKKNQIARFLKQGSKVKVTLRFKGREMAHTQLAFKLLNDLASELEEVGSVEAMPKLDGRSMVMVFGPNKVKDRKPKLEQPVT
ncbi:MAG TPA: translation initiation factor IF-3 [Actinomycetota bacterium]|nr:translation initiation factor IF-3 [Actinomycetota bacterium]